MVSLSARITTALKTAVRREERTSEVYREKAKRMKDPKARDILESLARQEEVHAAKIQRVLERGDMAILGKRKGLSLFEGLSLKNDDVRKMGKETEAAKVIRDAVKAEENSYRFYTGLAKLSKGLDVADLFTRLADEELKHKARLKGVLVRL